MEWLRLRLRLSAVWARSPSTALAAIVATVVGVAALTMGAILLFGNADERTQPDAPPSAALSFAVLAGSTVNNTGPSVITGDLGGAKVGKAITGFPPGILHGTKHDADATAFQAQTDLTTAYFDAANRTSDMVLPADVGGMTLIPGVYDQPRALGVTGTLTLDGRDDPDAVFIFQAGSTLTTAPDSLITLTNGAKACNVFWQVGDSATLGANSRFSGTILSAGSMSAQTGTTVDGRVLARNGEVILDLSTVTLPSCDDTPPASPFAKIGLPPSDSSADPAVPGGSTSGSSTQGRSTTNPSTQGRSTTGTTTTGGTVPTVTTEPTLPTEPTETTTTDTTTTDTTTTTTTTTDPIEPPPIEPPPIEPPPIEPPPIP